MSYERPNILRMTGYSPGEQPADPAVVKLNTNENPYPPSDAVMDALRSIAPDDLRRYPPPTARPFQTVAAELHGMTPDNIIATNGGDELLRLAISTFVEPGQPIGVAEPSYSLYPVLAAVQDCPVVTVPLKDDWSIPEDLPERMNDAGVRLTFLVNPHAPSGRLTHADQLAAIADRLDGVLLIDEAYVDFTDPALNYDAVPLIQQFDNVLILRTLSKGYSLAGLRFGYGLGPPALIEPMQTKTRDSYNTDAIAQRIAAAALQHRDAARQNCAAVREERDRLTRELTALGLPCAPSQSNFILATVSETVTILGPVFETATTAADLYESLKQRNIFVRYFNQDRLRDKLRITVGTPDQNDALLAALRDIL